MASDRKLVKLALCFILVLSPFILSACDELTKAPPAKKLEKNVLKDYIKTPLDKANDAGKKIDQRNKKLMGDLDK